MPKLCVRNVGVTDTEDGAVAGAADGGCAEVGAGDTTAMDGVVDQRIGWEMPGAKM